MCACENQADFRHDHDSIVAAFRSLKAVFKSAHYAPHPTVPKKSITIPLFAGEHPNLSSSSR